MPAEDTTKIVVQRFCDEVVTCRNLNVANGLSAPNRLSTTIAMLTSVIYMEPSGPAAVRELIEIIRNRFSDFKVAVEDQMDAEADRVVTRFAVNSIRTHSASGVCGHDFSS
jgi:hypothetical protein